MSEVASSCALEPLSPRPLESEANFYGSYEWCLNIFPTVRTAIQSLSLELQRHSAAQSDWHRSEIRTNIYLLSCAICDVIDDHLSGNGYDFSKAASFLPLAGPALNVLQRAHKVASRGRDLRLRGLLLWRQEWGRALLDLLKLFLEIAPADPKTVEAVCQRLSSWLKRSLPEDVLARRIRVVAAFRSQDMSHHDVVALAKKFVTDFPERRQAVLITGLRTAGSYFAPLLHAYLESEGYTDVDSVTMRPKKGLSRWEKEKIGTYAAGGLAVLIDEPIYSGATLSKAVQQLQRAGFSRDRIVILVPIHASRRDWHRGSDIPSLSGVHIIPLEPEQWHKHRTLASGVEERLREYFAARGYVLESISDDGRAQSFNGMLRSLSDEKFHNRAKRVYEVTLRGEDGVVEKRFVLAKSVGWGWFSYHAFIAADRLGSFVPTVLGLRDGILYTEWLPQPEVLSVTGECRSEWIDKAAAYVAARVQTLPLGSDPVGSLLRENRHPGFSDLVSNLSRAYGFRPVAVLKRARIAHELSRLECPCPTLLDGKMRPLEWVRGASGLLKSDFEHHGLGKTEANLTDPAADLAQLVLHWKLSAAEEQQMLKRYVELTGDNGIAERLLLNKLAVGIRTMELAIANLNDSRLAHRAEEFNRDYIAGWDFLVSQTMRYCAGLCAKPQTRMWRSPVVSLDVDGVLDKQIFGFPSTTVAGMQAISLLHSHGFSIAINTARCVSEVMDYCDSYGFVGGVAEYGAYVWDALSRRERVLISPESLRQVELLKASLRSIPGVFLNDNYRYSLRAYTYRDGTTVPVPTLLIQNLISTLKLDRLKFHQTFTDTAVVATDVDKGVGLRALLALVGEPDVATIAVGDSEADVPMFSVATKSFSPGNCSARRAAGALGCVVVEEPYQMGLLDIARRIIHPEGSGCERCNAAQICGPKDNLVLSLLKLADESQIKALLRALLDPMILRTFVT